MVMILLSDSIILPLLSFYHFSKTNMHNTPITLPLRLTLIFTLHVPAIHCDAWINKIRYSKFNICDVQLLNALL